MTNIAKPIIKQIKDNREALDFFENILLPAEDEKTQEIIANFPRFIFTIGRTPEILRSMSESRMTFSNGHVSIMMRL